MNRQVELLLEEGMEHLKRGEIQEARRCLEEAAPLAPRSARASFLLGVIAQEEGNQAEAVARYSQSLELDPNQPEAHLNLGLALKETNQPGEAGDHYRRALEIWPDFPEAHLNLGNLHQMAGRSDDAERCYRRCLELQPDLCQPHQNLSSILLWQKRFQESFIHAQKALSLAPAAPDVLNTMGAWFLTTGQATQAIHHFQQALDVAPNEAGYWVNLGGAKVDLHQYAEAEKCFLKAIKLDSGHSDARYGLALLQLKTGHFKEGWRGYEWRWKTPGLAKHIRHESRPRWDGRSYPEKTLLIHTEQGLGDAIQFARYIPRAVGLTGDVFLECQQTLAPLFRDWEGVELITLGQPFPEFDIQIPIGSLPLVFGADPSRDPSPVSYLRVPDGCDPGLPAREGEQIRIGFVWAGNPDHAADANRSMKTVDWRELLKAGTQFAWVSLQLEPDAASLEMIRKHSAAWDASPRLKHFGNTAAVMDQLDLVISVDTAVAHLAGALGKPVWLMLPHAGEWRWMNGRDDSPWYVTMRLFRQESPGDWKGVIKRVIAALRECSETGRIVPSGNNDWTAEADTPISVFLDRVAVRLKVPTTTVENLSGKPVSADDWLQAGNRFLGQEELAKAADCFLQAVRQRSEWAGALYNLGIALHKLGYLEGAGEAFEHSLRLEPGFTDASQNLALILEEQGDQEAAIMQLRQGLEADPRHVPLLVHLGRLLKEVGQFGGAEEALQKAFELEPVNPTVNLGLADLFQQQGLVGRAIGVLMEAVTAVPENGAFWNALGTAFRVASVPDKAHAALDRAIQLDPSVADWHSNLGNALMDLNKTAEALQAHKEASRLNPRSPGISHNRSLALLKTGDWEQGWAAYETRLQLPGFDSLKKRFQKPRWNGEQFGGTLLIWAEQGYGDTIQFIRFVPMVKKLGGRVVVECRTDVTGLLMAVEGIDEVVPRGDEPPLHDLQCPMLSLPFIFQIRPDSIPGAVPYLSVPAGVSMALPGKSSTRLNAGIVWSGSRSGDQREIPAPELDRLLAADATRFFSLQKESPEKTAILLEKHQAHDMADRLHDFSATAALMSQLDLVISVDTSAAHLAGALGKPVWLLLPFAGEWRWLEDRKDSPWYPTMKLFRQSKPGDWKSVIDSVVRKLGTMTNPAHQTPMERAAQLHQQNRPREALEIYEQLVVENPDNALLLRLTGTAYRQMGNHSKASECLTVSLKINPSDPEAHHEMGLLHADLDELDRAAAAFREAIALQPDCADFHYNLGNALYASGDREAAELAYCDALDRDAGLIRARFNLGQVAQDRGDYSGAVEAYTAVLEKEPELNDARINLGLALSKLGQAKEAEDCFQIILSKQPGHPMAGVNLAKLLTRQNRISEAQQACREVLRHEPGQADALLNLGVALQAGRRVDEAIVTFRQALEARHDFADARFNLGIAELLSGDWEAGWKNYEARWQTDNPVFAPRHAGIPLWNGEVLKGKTLLLYAEQGYGDTIQFCRYAPLFADRGAARMILECQPGLKTVMQTLHGSADVIEQGEPVPVADFRLPLLSAPMHFHTTPVTVPGNCLSVPDLPGLQDLPGQSSGQYRIGITWFGSRNQPNDQRPVPFEALLPLFRLPNALFFALHQQSVEAEICQAGLEGRVFDLSTRLSDFGATAKVLSIMDLILSVDTAVAHLAGAMSFETWTLLKFSPDWRWLLNRTDTPWYPGTRLFRQETSGDWGPVIEKVKAELEQRLPGQG